MNDKEKNITECAVSIIMPAYNSELYIEPAIHSVIEQTYRNWELLVIDDGSTDSTCSIVQRLAANDDRIKFIKNSSNMGVAKTRNRGLDLCSGDYVAFLDSDDIWYPNKLSLQIQKMKAKDADLAYSSYAIVDSQGNPSKNAYIVPENITFDDLLKENVIGCSTVIISRNLAKKYRFAIDFYHEDYCLWLDILHDGYKAVGCSDVLVKWRLIANSRSFNKRKSAMNRWRIYRRHLHFSFLKSIKLFFSYMFSGIKKYYG